MMEEHEVERATKPTMTRHQFQRTVKEIQNLLAQDTESLGEKQQSIDIQQWRDRQTKTLGEKAKETYQADNPTATLPIVEENRQENRAIREGDPIYDEDVEKSPVKTLGSKMAREKSKRRSQYEELTEEELAAMEAEAQERKEKGKKADSRFGEEDMVIDPVAAFQNLLKEGGGDGGAAGIGTVAVSSDPGVFTETYGARKRKIMNRKGKGSKASKSGPEKLDDFLKNSANRNVVYKTLDDETFLLELVGHVSTELRKEGQSVPGYTPENERPYQPAYPQELKAKGPRAKREINESPTTENTVPVSGGEGALGQSNIPQESVLVPPGVDDQRNMNRPVKRKKDTKSRVKSMSLDVGAFLTPGNESGNNYQNTAVAFTAMQKIGTHGNELANTPKQFGTERPQAAYIEKKPRMDPNSDIEQEEFVGNVDSIRDEDKNRKGRTYENNKEGNNANAKQIDTYTMNMGGHALQAFTKEMRDVGLDSLHRQSDDDITEPD